MPSVSFPPFTVHRPPLPAPHIHKIFHPPLPPLPPPSEHDHFHSKTGEKSARICARVSTTFREGCLSLPTLAISWGRRMAMAVVGEFHTETLGGVNSCAACLLTGGLVAVATSVHPRLLLGVFCRVVFVLCCVVPARGGGRQREKQGMEGMENKDTHVCFCVFFVVVSTAACENYGMPAGEA